MDVKAIVALALVGLGVLLDIVGLAIPYWRSGTQDLGIIAITYNYGLWSLCAKDASCVSFTGPIITGTLQATRAMVILGMLLGMGALVCFLLRQFVMKDKAILNKVAAGLAIAAGILMLIGAIIYATDSDYKDSPFKLHAGFALVIVAGVFELVGGVFFFLVPDDQ